MVQFWCLRISVRLLAVLYGIRIISVQTSGHTSRPRVPDVVISKEELAKHDHWLDCWSAIDGLVYHITPFVGYHINAKETILKGCGKDVTETWKRFHNSVDMGYLTIAKGTYGDHKQTSSLNSLGNEMLLEEEFWGDSPLQGSDLLSEMQRRTANVASAAREEDSVQSDFFLPPVAADSDERYLRQTKPTRQDRFFAGHLGHGSILDSLQRGAENEQYQHREPLLNYEEDILSARDFEREAVPFRSLMRSEAKDMPSESFVPSRGLAGQKQRVLQDVTSTWPTRSVSKLQRNRNKWSLSSLSSSYLPRKNKFAPVMDGTPFGGEHLAERGHMTERVGRSRLEMPAYGYIYDEP